ncbi:MAG: CpsD/CapB family tyrosine-protein kinase [Deltaproteobacteria bacterium]|jgi:Mrp family chromosome partitioning ATPase|nr:CpsD/CapB family tyrosine-protein kinase [Deltaproteobacteria bacterium]MDA8307014.1 CpsD/CapB family tyrosine-protein kinase [Deltaproteobacteria bacterium]
MSKIYEALQNIHREKKGDGTPTPASVPPPFAVAGPAGFGLEVEMLGLYKVIETLLPHQKSRIVQFIGTREGEGTSTVAREFARVSADMVGHSVLLLDADRHNPSQDHFFDIQDKFGWLDALRSEEPGGNPFHRVGQSKLFVSPGSDSAVSTPEVFNSKFEHMCHDFRGAFDLVVIDSAPLAVSPDGLAVASRVDGIVLVVEAEKTRWQAVKTMRDSISRVGGNILGVVLNKRRYYIPESIYKYL